MLLVAFCSEGKRTASTGLPCWSSVRAGRCAHLLNCVPSRVLCLPWPLGYLMQTRIFKEKNFPFFLVIQLVENTFIHTGSNLEILCCLRMQVPCRAQNLKGWVSPGLTPLGCVFVEIDNHFEV